MDNRSVQEKRLDYLVDSFKAEAPEYRRVRIPSDMEGKRYLLRSLMNVRDPKPVSDAVLAAQDAYLKGRALEKGVVNIAANSQMMGCYIPMHACIDNCIHTYAGIQLREDCGRRMRSLRLRFGDEYEQPTAVPMLTDAYNLPSKKIIHIVGPIVQYELTPELEEDLADCYRNTLDMCRENGLKSVAFCCISTGVFHFPNKRAAEIAVSTVSEWLAEDPDAMDRVIFNVFKDEDRRYYEELF